MFNSLIRNHSFITSSNDVLLYSCQKYLRGDLCLISKIFIDGIKIVCSNPEKLGNRKISTMMGCYIHYFERQLMANGEYEK